MKKKKSLSTNLYTDMKEGIISQDEYVYAKKRYQVEIAHLQQRIEELKTVAQKPVNSMFQERKWSYLADAYINAKKLTSEMIDAMVDTIRFHADGSIDVTLKYMNEFADLIEECEKLRKESA